MKGHACLWTGALAFPILLLAGSLGTAGTGFSNLTQIGLATMILNPSEQGARLTMLNPNPLPERNQPPVNLMAEVRLFDALGNMVGEPLEFQLPPGEGRAWDVPRARLAATADPSTGVTSGHHVIVRFTVSPPLPGGTAAGTVAQASGPGIEPGVAFLETIETQTGKTQISQLLSPPDRPEPPGPRNVAQAGLATIGFVPGQALRLMVTHPDEPGGDRPEDRPILVARCFFFDSSGRLVSESEDLVVPARQSRSCEVAREALTPPGEPDTGRLQVQALLRYRVLRPRPNQPAPLASVYVLDPVPGSAARKASCLSNTKQLGTAFH